MKVLKQYGAQLAIAAAVGVLSVLGYIDPLLGVMVIGAVTLPTKGRSIGVYRGATPTLVAGVRTKSLTVNGSPIDVTNDDDAAVRKLLAEPGEIQVTITVSGILKNETLLEESLDATDRVQPTEFRWPGGTAGKLAGDFFLSAFSITGEYQGSATFEATFESAGTVAFTAAL